jgi:hypothetical protein
MVCNYLILKFLLLGMAAYHKKIDIDLVVKLFQSFTRFAAHNTNYMKAVISCLEARNLGDFRSLIVLLLDGVQENSTNTYFYSLPNPSETGLPKDSAAKIQ